MPQKRNTNKASNTRLAIIDTAETLVIEGGMDSLTLDAIASECGITVQTIYNRVGGRAAILIAIAERALEDNRQYMDAAYARSGSAYERMLAVSEGYARFAAEKPYAFRLMANPPQEPQALERITQLVQKHNSQLMQVIKDGIKAGEIRTDIDPFQTATAIWAAANGLLSLNWRADGNAMTQGQFADILQTGIKVVMDGLFRPKSN